MYLVCNVTCAMHYSYPSSSLQNPATHVGENRPPKLAKLGPPPVVAGLAPAVVLHYQAVRCPEELHHVLPGELTHEWSDNLLQWHARVGRLQKTIHGRRVQGVPYRY